MGLSVMKIMKTKLSKNFPLYGILDYGTANGIFGFFCSTIEGGLRQKPKLVRILIPGTLKKKGLRDEFTVGPAMFGPELGAKDFQVGAGLVEMSLVEGQLDNGCSEYSPEQAEDIKGNIILVNRGGCLFVHKVCIQYSVVNCLYS